MDCVALKIEGLDEAIIGISDVWDSSGKKEERFIYNGDKILDILHERDGMGYDEAREFLIFNIEGAYVGPNTPVVVWPIYGEEQ